MERAGEPELASFRYWIAWTVSPNNTLQGYLLNCIEYIRVFWYYIVNMITTLPGSLAGFLLFMEKKKAIWPYALTFVGLILSLELITCRSRGARSGLISPDLISRMVSFMA